MIEDKIEPVITCPANIDIYCDEGYNIWDLEQFGQPAFFDNCSTDTTYIREWDLGQCHTGFLYRRWIVTDGGGLTDECAQKITVLHNSDFVVDLRQDPKRQDPKRQDPKRQDPKRQDPKRQDPRGQYLRRQDLRQHRVPEL